MNILMATDTFYPKIDGIVTSVMNSSEYLSKRGNNIAILAPTYLSKHDEFRMKRVKIYRFPAFSLPTYKEVRVSFPSLNQIAAIFDEFRPDIVHIHTPGTIGLQAMIIAKRRDVMIVNTYHTSLPDMMVYLNLPKIPQLKLTLQEKKPKNKRIARAFTEAKLTLAQFKKRFGAYFSKHKKEEAYPRKLAWAISAPFYSKSDLVIAPTSSIKKELRRHGIKAVEVIPSGIELDIFKKKAQFNTPPTFLHVGRIGFEKQVDVVIKALSIVLKTYPKTYLTVVGDGPALRHVKQVTSELGVMHNVTFTGFVERNNLPRIYQAHDVFLTGSEMETQGLVIIEAMASGLPVIGPKVLALPDVIFPGKNGFLIGKKDAKGMARYMIKFIENPEMISLCGSAARKEAENFSIDKTMRKLENAYNRLNS